MLLNLKDVEYMSSSGLRIFVSTMRILKESQKLLKLSNMNSSVKKINCQITRVVLRQLSNHYYNIISHQYLPGKQVSL